MESFTRKEYKYYVPLENLEEIKKRVTAYMVHDPFCLGRSENRYPVRSIYFDTRNLLFYFEKMAGQKIRKKLRVRTYDTKIDRATVYLEIKRKRDEYIVKERVRLSWEEWENFGGAQKDEIDTDLFGGYDWQDRIVRERFIYLLHRLSLREKALIAYEREAFHDPVNPDLRITFDYNVRSLLNPARSDLFTDMNTRTFGNPFFILEIKFSLTLPRWVRQLLKDFRLQNESISKYCLGVDCWQDREPRLKAS
ncbi:polyphosphate polymerase domain-containing protein [bacterium]|nr:polyphosphate polymerase domain-containing protein [bacterium]